MQRSQAEIWGWYDTGHGWVKVAVDANGKLLVYDDSQWVPKNSFLETWQDEAGIDPILWTVTDPATGTAWTRGTIGTRMGAYSAPNANETARLRRTFPWLVNPGVFDTTQIIQRLKLVFEMQLVNVLNIDNALSILGGFTSGGLANRGTNNILGFGLVGDALQTFSDAAGVETVNTGFGETLTDWNKYGIEISAGSVAFYLNEALIATHTTNLFDLPAYINFYLDTEGGGASTIRLGTVLALSEVKLR